MKITQTVLQNGITTVLSDLPDSNSITVFLLIKTGSLQERIPGLAHFIEHVVFKGTVKRPTAFDINNEIEKVGGYINAATSQEFTELYIKIPTDHYEKAFDILGDMVMNSTFDSTEIEKEKDVVIEEINMYEDMPIRNVSDSFYAFLWQSHPLGRPIMGTAETVKGINRNDIVSFMEEHYRADNIIVAVAGDLANKDILGMCETYFGNIKKRDSATQPLQEGNILVTDNLSFYTKAKETHFFHDTHTNVRVEKRNTKQTHFCLGFEGLSYSDPRMYALEVAGGILAEGSSSYLWQKIREELGASYYLDSEIDSFKSSGVWYIHAGVDADKIEEVVSIILSAFKKLTQKEFSETELMRAKEYLKGDFVMNIEGSEEIARYIAHEIFEQGEVRSIEKEKNLIDSVTLDTIAAVSSEIFQKPLFFNMLSKKSSLDELEIELSNRIIFVS